MQWLDSILHSIYVHSPPPFYVEPGETEKIDISLRWYSCWEKFAPLPDTCIYPSHLVFQAWVLCLGRDNPVMIDDNPNNYSVRFSFSIHKK